MPTITALPGPVLCVRSGPGATVAPTYGQNMYLSDVSGDEGTDNMPAFTSKRKAAIRAPTFYDHHTIISYKVIEVCTRYWLPQFLDISGDVVWNEPVPCPNHTENALSDPSFDARVRKGIFPLVFHIVYARDGVLPCRRHYVFSAKLCSCIR